MQVYKTFLRIALKSISSGIAYIVIFTSLSFILAKVNSSDTKETFNAKKIEIAVVDRDNSELSNSLYDYLDSTQKVEAIDDDENAWSDELFYHSVEAIIVIEDGFEAAIVSGNTEGLVTSYANPDSNCSYIVESAIQTYISNIGMYIKTGYNYEDAAAAAKANSEITATVDILSEDSGKSPTAMSYFFTYIPYMMSCIVINALGPMLLIWNKRELRERTAIASLSQTKINSQIIGALTCCSGVIFGLFAVIAACAYGKDLFTVAGIYYILNSICYMLVCVAFTYIVSLICTKVQSIAIWSNLFGLSTSFMCGVFVTRDLLADGVVSASKCLPTYWYINVTEELRYFDGTLSRSSYNSMFIQLLFAIAFFAIGLIIVKTKQQRTA